MTEQQYANSLPVLEKAHQLVMAYENKTVQRHEVVTAARAWLVAVGSVEPLPPDMASVCKMIKDAHSVTGRLSDVMGQLADLVAQVKKAS